MVCRFLIYFHCWRRKGAARLDHRLLLHWAIFNRYPRIKP